MYGSPTPANRRSVTITTQPASEPVALADVKLALALDPSDTTWDTMLTRQITAARQAVENYLNRTLITTTRLLTMDSFPAQGAAAFPLNAVETSLGYGSASNALNIPMGPVQSVQSFKYQDQSNTEQTVSASTYFTDTAGARLILNTGQSWPTGQRGGAGIGISYKAGFGDNASDVPATIREAIIQVVCRLYEGRGCCSMEDAIGAVSGLLSGYRFTNSFGRIY